MNFTETLATLDDVSHLQKIELFNADGSLNATIENKSGQKGSLRIYAHLAKKYGSINTDAAQEGLNLYCEHTDDAEINPGKHPNIDRLFDVLEADTSLKFKLI